MKKTFIFAGLILLVAVSFQLFGKASQRKNLEAKDIGSLLPRELAGWVVEDRPVADSPEMLKTVEKILSYDSAVFRIYKKDGIEISVYVAYWLPAKIPVTHVDAHTPDICWVANGWKMKKMAPLPDQATTRGVLAVPNVRDFEVSGHELSVVYWHVNGSVLRQNSSVWEPSLTAMQRVNRRMNQIKNILFDPPGQQLFVRISANRNMKSEIHSEPVVSAMQLVAAALAGDVFYSQK